MNLSTPNVIETHGLSKTNKNVRALRSLDLKVHQNSIFGIPGTNAAYVEFVFCGLFIGKIEPFLGKFATNIVTTIPFVLNHAGNNYMSDTFIFFYLATSTAFPGALLDNRMAILGIVASAFWKTALLVSGAALSTALVSIDQLEHSTSAGGRYDPSVGSIDRTVHSYSCDGGGGVHPVLAGCPVALQPG